MTPFGLPTTLKITAFAAIVLFIATGCEEVPTCGDGNIQPAWAVIEKNRVVEWDDSISVVVLQPVGTTDDTLALGAEHTLRQYASAADIHLVEGIETTHWVDPDSCDTHTKYTALKTIDKTALSEVERGLDAIVFDEVRTMINAMDEANLEVTTLQNLKASLAQIDKERIDPDRFQQLEERITALLEIAESEQAQAAAELAEEKRRAAELEAESTITIGEPTNRLHEFRSSSAMGDGEFLSQCSAFSYTAVVKFEKAQGATVSLGNLSVTLQNNSDLTALGIARPIEIRFVTPQRPKGFAAHTANLSAFSIRPGQRENIPLQPARLDAGSLMGLKDACGDCERFTVLIEVPVSGRSGSRICNVTVPATQTMLLADQ